MSIKCCLRCQDRGPTCHATCQRYREEKAADELRREAENKRKGLNQLCNDQRGIAVERALRKKRR